MLSNTYPITMNNLKILVLGSLLTLFFAAYLFYPSQEATYAASAPVEPNPDAIEFSMYKNPGCGCCTLWAEHMMKDGEFVVKEVPSPNLSEIKEEAGVPRTLSSCHTSKIEGYIVEGHVPIEDVKRLLKEKPDAIGITVPGMPIGSPGMEVTGRPADKYDVLLIKNDGTTEVFASH